MSWTTDSSVVAALAHRATISTLRHWVTTLLSAKTEHSDQPAVWAPDSVLGWGEEQVRLADVDDHEVDDQVRSRAVWLLAGDRGFTVEVVGKRQQRFRRGDLYLHCGQLPHA